MVLVALVMNTKRFSTELFIPKQFIIQEKWTTKQLIKFVDSLLSTTLQNVDYEELKKRMVGVDSEFYSEELEKQNRIIYRLMEGKCQDEERLSYFIPSKIIKQVLLPLMNLRN